MGDVAEADLEARIVASDGTELVAYRLHAEAAEPIPSPAEAIGSPESLDSNESLFLAAVHLEQYRHATRDPEPYYREALKRDASDSRCNVGLAKLMMNRGRPDLAVPLCEAAIERLTRHNPNPVTGEAHLQLGLALVMLGRDSEAETPLWKACWSDAQRSAASFELARLALRASTNDNDRRSETLQLLETSLQLNANHHQASHLKVAVLFDLGRDAEAMAVAEAELKSDPFAFGVLFELASRDAKHWDLYDHRTRSEHHAALELAHDYTNAGLHTRARDVLTRCLGYSTEGPGAALCRYHLAAAHRQLGEDQLADKQAELAAAMPRDLCFPNKYEDIAVLREATDRNPADALAPYALGNLLYDRKQHDDAIKCWQTSIARDPSFATAHRNLGIALFAAGDHDAAYAMYETAFDLNPSDARVLYELDQLAKRLGHDPRERLDRLDRFPSLIEQRDDLSLERVTLMNGLGLHREALTAILSREYRPWEGGEGRVPAQFIFATCRLAEQAIAEGQAEEALALLQQTEQWPQSLGEGKLAGIQENDIHYLSGLALQQLGREDEARDMFEQAATGLAEPTSAMFYNDQPPEMIYFQGLALQALGRDSEANDRFNRLLDYGQTHLDDDVEIDYFAVSLPDFLIFEPDLNAKNRTHCHLMMAFGRLGLGQTSDAAEHLEQVLKIDASHQWAAHLTRPNSSLAAHA
ncbi:MAG: tetratricopeptide repeat protein [Planctomycetota bacterium]